MGMLDSAICCFSLFILIEKLALKDGSSKHGKAIRAEVGSKWVEARILPKDTQIVHKLHLNMNIKQETLF